LDFTTSTNADPLGMLDIHLTAESGARVTILEGGHRYVDLANDDGVIVGGNPAVPFDLRGGTMAGALAVRNGTLVDLRQELDLAARQLVASVNAAYNPLGDAGEDFFDPAGLAAGSIALSSDLTPSGLRSAAVGAQGGNAIALALVDLNAHAFSTGAGDALDGTLKDHLLGLTTRLGEEVAGVRARGEAQATVQRFLTDQRDAVSGVNLDEEVTNMIRFQRSYQASSRLIRVLDEMLETLVTQL
jgi:flagellar hook-associated protein 1 FlgK